MAMVKVHRVKDGYFLTYRAGESHRHRIGAHRLIWEECFGPIPDGMCVCHHCDNPGCVAPDHLFLGTRLENMCDRTAKNRAAVGEHAGSSKLTEGMVREMRTLAAQGVSHRRLAKRFWVAPNTAYCVIKGKTWKHI